MIHQLWLLQFHYDVLLQVLLRCYNLIMMLFRSQKNISIVNSQEKY